MATVHQAKTFNSFKETSDCPLKRYPRRVRTFDVRRRCRDLFKPPVRNIGIMQTRRCSTARNTMTLGSSSSSTLLRPTYTTRAATCRFLQHITNITHLTHTHTKKQQHQSETSSTYSSLANHKAMQAHLVDEKREPFLPYRQPHTHTQKAGRQK
jgi:hypothetical protein